MYIIHFLILLSFHFSLNRTLNTSWEISFKWQGGLGIGHLWSNISSKYNMVYLSHQISYLYIILSYYILYLLYIFTYYDLQHPPFECKQSKTSGPTGLSQSLYPRMYNNMFVFRWRNARGHVNCCGVMRGQIYTSRDLIGMVCSFKISPNVGFAFQMNIVRTIFPMNYL